VDHVNPQSIYIC